MEGMKKYKIKKKHLTKRQLSKITLSRNTIKRKVELIASDLETQMLNDLRSSPIGHALQSDASTDIDNKEQLVAFVSYENQCEIKREMLFLKEIELHSNAKETLKAIDDYYTENDLDHNMRTDNTSDGCNTMMGNKTGVMTQSKHERSLILQELLTKHFILQCKTVKQIVIDQRLTTAFYIV